MKRKLSLFILLFFFFSAEKTHSQNWIPFPLTFDKPVWWFNVNPTNNELIIGGMFTSVDSVQQVAICGWNGSSIIDYNNGLRNFVAPSGSIRQTAFYNNQLYACGAFQKCFNKPDSMNSIAKWNGTEWDTVFNVTNSQGIFSFNSIDDTLFIGGLFDYIYEQPCSGVLAFYNGQIVKCYSGFPDPNHRIAGVLKYQNELYAYGLISDSLGFGGQINICKWNESTQLWDRVNNAFSNSDGSINDAVVYNGELYVCGDFDQSGTVAGNNIMKWDGQQWSNIGDLNYFAWDMEVHDGLLFVAGSFTEAGGIPANQIAYYDGNNWHSFNPDPITGDISKMTFYNNELYIGGGFGIIYPNDTLFYIAKWNGALPSGTNEIQQNNFSIFPNPVYSTVTLHSTEKINSLTIFNIMGEKIYSTQPPKTELDLSFLTSGIYITQIQTLTTTQQSKFIKQ